MKRHWLPRSSRLKKKAVLSFVPEFAPLTGDRGPGAAKVIGWASVAVGVAALGVFVGREIRLRYKFKRRTPYDFYAHSADKVPQADYGMGI